MLRYRSIDLPVRNTGLAGFRPRSAALYRCRARCLSTTPIISPKSPDTVEEKVSKSRGGRKSRWKDVMKHVKATDRIRHAEAPLPGVNNTQRGGDDQDILMTEAEYERSLWEAQREQSSPEHEVASPKLSTLKTEDRRSSSEQQKGALWKTLRTKLQEPSTTEGTCGTTGSSPKKKAKSSSAKESKTPLEVKVLYPNSIKFNPVEEENLEVPALSYGLDRVLFNPGVYQIQDTRSQVFNFDPYLTTIMPVDEFDFDALKAYITSSKDTKLREMAKKHGAKYCGSTSSMTAMLSHLHFLLSGWRKPNLSMISRSLEPESTNFTKITRSPAAAYARLKDGVYAIDADKEYDKENILSMLGKSMEKLLTLPREEFEKYRRTRSHLISEDERNADEAFHYTTLGDFLMRSQLDARDSRLPGTGVFDLKTRAVVSIRMDMNNHEAARGYEIKHRIGQWESFEREYYDMIRSAFLKYSLQVRMGRMDGIFLAYHNTQRIFGFQYVSLEEMDAAIHGSNSRRLGDQEFATSVELLNDLINRATERFPGRSLRLHIETRDTKVPVTYFFAEPVTDEDMATSKEAAKRSVEKVQEDIMSMRAQQDEAESLVAEQEMQSKEEQPTEDSNVPAESAANENDLGGDGWEDVMSKVEEFVDDDAQGTLDVKDVQDVLEQEDLLHHMAEDETALDDFADALKEELTAVKGIRELEQTAPPAQPPKESIEPSHQGPSEVGAEQPVEVPGTVSEKVSTPKDDELREIIFKAVVEAGKRSVRRRAELGENTAKPGYSDNGGVETEESASDGEVQQSPEQAQAPGAEGLGAPKDEQSPKAQSDAQSESIGPEEQTSTGQAKEPTTEHDQPLPTVSARSTEAAKRRARFQAPGELMGLYITVRNKVNGKFVEQPEDVHTKFNWSVGYTVNEMADNKAREIYSQLRNRRFQALNQDSGQGSKPFMDNYRERLKEMAKKGESYRKHVEDTHRGKDVYVAWDEKPFPPETRSYGVDGPKSYED